MQSMQLKFYSGQYDTLMNTAIFEISTTEVYNKVIPKYFTQPAKTDLPRINGVKVSWEEYLEKHPEYSKEEEFIPDMVYNPCDMNMATAQETCAGIIDLIENNIDFSLAKPEYSYPRILEIIEGYIESAKIYLPNNPDLQLYVNKSTEALKVLTDAYDRWKRRMELKTTGKIDDGLTGFDRIAKRFLKPED